MIVLAAALVFAIVVIVVVGGWWGWSHSRRLRERISMAASASTESPLLSVERKPAQPSFWDQFASKSDIMMRLSRLSEQAGRQQSPTDLSLMLAAFAAIGAVIGWWRIGSVSGVMLSAGVAGCLPVLYLLYKRQQRVKRLDEQFADAVDMIARSIRSGNALTAAIQLVGEEMPEPTRAEFRRVADEIRLGMDPTEALGRLQERVPSEDMRFFCAAINIQRTSGGNLAEILDRLAEVVRRRFELLSHARVLSAQQRYAAFFVGFSPIIFAILFYFISPGYFDPLLKSPMAGLIIGSGLALEAVGFAVIWRLAQIKV